MVDFLPPYNRNKSIRPRRQTQTNSNTGPAFDPWAEVPPFVFADSQTGKADPTKAHIVGLVCSPENAGIPGCCFRNALQYCDHLVVAASASDELTAAVVRQLQIQAPGRLTLIVSSPHRLVSTPSNTEVVDVAAKLQPTHWVLLTSQQLVTIPVANYLRRAIAGLGPTDRLQLPLLQVWGGFHRYRVDPAAGSLWHDLACGTLGLGTHRPAHMASPPMDSPQKTFRPVLNHRHGGILDFSFSASTRCARLLTDPAILAAAALPQHDDIILDSIPASWIVIGEDDGST